MKLLKLSPSSWMGFCILLLAVSRLPMIFTNHELSPDESMQLALAHRMLGDWVPWRGADFTTSGPLNPVPAVLIAAITDNFAYSALHIADFLLLGVILAGSWQAARRFFHEKAAVAAALIVTLWLIHHRDSEFTHYASETLPSALIAIGLACAAIALAGERWRPFYLIPAGVALGLAPWAKLQAGPISLSVLLWAAFAIRKKTSRRLASLGAMALAAGAPTLAIVFIGLRFGVLDDIFTSYFLNNLSYAGKATPLSWIKHLVAALDSGVLLHVLPLALFLWVLRNSRRESFTPRPLVLPILLVAAALYSICRSQYSFSHYYIFLLAPTLLAGAGLFCWLGETLDPQILGGKLEYAALMVCLVPWIPSVFTELRLYRRELAMAFPPTVESSPLASAIPAGSSLFIWGWSPRLYITLHARPATRYVLTAFHVDKNKYVGFYRKNLMSDLHAEKPEFIITSDWIGALDLGENPTFDELAQFIAEKYVEIQRLEKMTLYRRREPS